MADLPSRSTYGYERTAAPLAIALLGYFLLVTLVITLSPFDFAPRPLRISLMMVPRDIVANITLFLPIGFLVRSLHRGPGRRGWQAVAFGGAFSLAIEIAQIFIRGRYVSPVDVATNTAGALLGVWLRDRLDRWAVWDPRLVGRIGLDMPLVGLLYLLVPQLWLSSVGVVDDVRRSAVTLLLGCTGTIVLVALHRHHWDGGATLQARAVPPLATLWFTVGAFPALAASPRTFAASALCVALLTWWQLRPRQANTSPEQRFEVDTLRRVLPLFVLYLVIAALWPPFRGVTDWHGAFGFANRLNNAGIVDLLLLLEQVAGFTLLGYAMAEWRGRRELGLVSDLRLLVPAALLFAIVLELAQGFLVGPGASLVRAALSTSGGVYGVAVYHLARAHVRALRAVAAPAAEMHRAA